jgi:two-component system nitrogen regulation sensor histidine kinase NtrY
MSFKNFRFQIILRILLLNLSMLLLIILLIKSKLYASIFLIAVIIIYQTISLIRYIETTNRRLSQFLQSIRYADFSQSFSIKGLGSSFNELNRAFSDVIYDFRKIRKEKEEQYQYLQTVVQHVGIGLITFYEDGEIELMNSAAKRLLNRPKLHRIQQLENINTALPKTIMNLKSGQHTMLKIHLNGDLMQLAIYGTQFMLRNRMITLVSLQNIRSQLEEREMEAWQKLIRVLTHEIMNSITPISSMAGSVKEILEEIQPVFLKKNNDNLEENYRDINSAVQTIQKRSEGLLQFVEAYRSLTRLPSPKFKEFSVADIFRGVKKLMGEEIKERNIQLQCITIPEHLKLTADPAMVEQILINLLKNASDAVNGQESPQIKIKGFTDEKGRTIIQVNDNGSGISEDLQEKIFVPFFTTKKDGSGIGLSLSRQIMRLLKGSIYIQSQVGTGTTVNLIF